MTRIIKEISNANNPLTIRSFIKDTYVRPALAAPDPLEKLGAALIDVEPDISKYLTKVQEDKNSNDIQVGYALYHMAGDGDATIEEAKQRLVETGDLNAAKDITKAMRYGFNYERHKTAGLMIASDMQEWENAGVTTDKEGNPISINSIENAEERIDAFFKKQAEVTTKYLGNGYDPELFAKCIQPEIDRTVQQFIGNQSKARAEVLYNRQVAAYGGTLGALFDRLIVNSEFVLDDTIMTPEMAAEYLQIFINDGMKHGLNEADVVKETVTMLRSVMYDYDVDNISGIKEVVKNIPIIWNDPTYRGIIESTAKNAAEQKISSDNSKRLQKERENQEKINTAYAAMLERHDYDPSQIPSTEWKELMKIAPSETKLIAQMQDAFYNVYSNSVEAERGMSDAEFYRTYGDFATGKKGLGSLFSYASKTTPSQYRELVGASSLYKSTTKAGDSGSGGAKSREAAYTKMKSQAMRLLTAGKDNDALDYSDAVLNDDIASRIAYEATKRGEAWKKKNKEADPIEYQMQMNQFIREGVTAYGANMEEYKKNPNTVKENPVQLRQKVNQEEASSILQSLPKNNDVIRSVVARINSDGGKETAFTRAEINELNKQLKETGYKNKGDKLIKDLVRIKKETSAK
ncbi:MAG: hypothetical protein RR091_09260 [Cloacibacillus sp.]